MTITKWKVLLGVTVAVGLLLLYVISYRYELYQRIIKAHENSQAHENKTQMPTKAQSLYQKVRVLVAVITSPQNLEKKAKFVRDTWAKRADKVLFLSSQNNATFPTVGLKVSEGRGHLTAKSMEGFRYIYQHHFLDADWFMKADDDTYVIMENLRHFLSNQNSSKPVFFGQLISHTNKQGYFSGGAGYVLSKEALRRLGVHGLDPAVCRQDGGAEDMEMGLCLEKLGVKAADDTDALGRSRFHSQNYTFYYHRYRTNYKPPSGATGVSDGAISFHYVTPEMMLNLEFYIYGLRLHL